MIFSRKSSPLSCFWFSFLWKINLTPSCTEILRVTHNVHHIIMIYSEETRNTRLLTSQKFTLFLTTPNSGLRRKMMKAHFLATVFKKLVKTMIIIVWWKKFCSRVSLVSRSSRATSLRIISENHFKSVISWRQMRE